MTSLKVGVYNSGKCALSAEPSKNEDDNAFTVNVDATSALPGSNRFDWDRKICVQITRSELPDVLAVLLGRKDDVKFTNHGKRRDKSYRVFLDGSRAIYQVSQANRSQFTVAIGESDRLALSTLLFRQIQRNHGGISGEVLNDMMKSIYRRPR